MQSAPQNSWHVTRGGQTFGPYTWEQMVEHARGGRIGRGDRILDPATGVWSKPTQVPALFGPGGVAAAPAGLSAIKIVAILVISAAVLASGAAAFYVWGPEGWGRRYEGDEILSGVEQYVEGENPESQTAVVPPEGLAFKGTFHWESRESAQQTLSHDDECYLWIYTTDEGTAASFNFGEHLVDGWPVYLTSQSGSHYVFNSSHRSLVEKVRIVVDVTDTTMSGTVTNTNYVGSFVGGTFNGSAIPYEEYRADVID